LKKKISDLIELHRPELDYDNKIQKKDFYLKSLKDIYFNGASAVERGYSRHGDRKKVMAYTSIAIFTLLLACINFINLNSAKSGCTTIFQIAYL
jgi:putative ABC transport system permease protein